MRSYRTEDISCWFARCALGRSLPGWLRRGSEVGQFQAQVAGVGGVGHAGLKFDSAGADQLFDFAIEVLHAFGCSYAHGVEQSLAVALAFFNVFAGTKGGL